MKGANATMSEERSDSKEAINELMQVIKEMPLFRFLLGGSKLSFVVIAVMALTLLVLPIIDILLLS